MNDMTDIEMDNAIEKYLEVNSKYKVNDIVYFKEGTRGSKFTVGFIKSRDVEVSIVQSTKRDANGKFNKLKLRKVYNILYDIITPKGVVHNVNQNNITNAVDYIMTCYESNKSKE